MSKTILVLGAGIGGIITATELRKKVGGGHPVKILVFEKEEKMFCAISALANGR